MCCFCSRWNNKSRLSLQGDLYPSVSSTKNQSRTTRDKKILTKRLSTCSQHVNIFSTVVIRHTCLTTVTFLCLLSPFFSPSLVEVGVGIFLLFLLPERMLLLCHPSSYVVMFSHSTTVYYVVWFVFINNSSSSYIIVKKLDGFVSYETIKRDLNKRLVYECRCD